MTKVKLCGMMQPADIACANRLMPDYVGFVFAAGSKRCVSTALARAMKAQLAEGVQAVGVFVDAPPEHVAELLEEGIIDIAQLHGREDEATIARLRQLTAKPIIQAFRVASAADIARANASSAEHVLLDAGGGSGTCFDWALLDGMMRPYFLAGGLDAANVAAAIARLHPYAVDVSSGIETDGHKDPDKMTAFMTQVRREQL